MVLPRFLPVAIVVAAFFWLSRWLATRRLTVRTPADWGIILILLMIPVTLWATALPEITVPQIYRLLSGVALYYAVINWTSAQDRLRLLVLGTFAAGLFIAFIAPFTVEWITSKYAFIPGALYDRFSVLVADTAHPNVLAGSLVLLLPSAIALPLFAWQEIPGYFRLTTVVTGLVVTIVLFLTQARGGLIAFIATLLTIIALRWRRGWVLTLIMGIAGVIFLLIFGVEETIDLISTESAFTSLQGRLEIWSRGIFMIQDFPFTGIGMGSFTQVADTLYPFFTAPPETIRHSHNLFIQIAVDLGIPGLIAWLSIWFLVAFSAWQVHRLGKEHGLLWYAGLGAGLLASQIALGVHGIVEAVVWGLVRPAPIVWGVWGVTIASWNLLVRSGKGK
jgi:putative inorganic carbon (HCO3(-)) transporter